MAFILKKGDMKMPSQIINASGNQIQGGNIFDHERE